MPSQPPRAAGLRQLDQALPALPGGHLNPSAIPYHSERATPPLVTALTSFRRQQTPQLTAQAQTVLAVSSHMGNVAGTSSLQHPIFAHINNVMIQQMNTKHFRWEPVSLYPSPFRFMPSHPSNELSCPQNHRMLGVGSDLCGSPSPTPCRSRVTQSRLHRTLYRQVLNISREGESTTSLGNLRGCGPSKLCRSCVVLSS